MVQLHIVFNYVINRYKRCPRCERDNKIVYVAWSQRGSAVSPLISQFYRSQEFFIWSCLIDATVWLTRVRYLWSLVLGIVGIWKRLSGSIWWSRKRVKSKQGMHQLAEANRWGNTAGPLDTTPCVVSGQLDPDNVNVTVLCAADRGQRAQWVGYNIADAP